MNRRLLAAAFLAMLPISSQAHLVSTGFGSYYDGMAHFFLSPVDWLLVVAVGLLAGLSGAAAGRATLVALPLGWLVGGFVGTFHAGNEWPLLMIFSFSTLGALVALDWKLPAPGLAGLAACLGALQGWANGSSMAGGDRTWPALLGAGSVVFFFATILPAIVVSLRPSWTRIAVRVLGSWILAIGILMFGWILRPR